MILVVIFFVVEVHFFKTKIGILRLRWPLSTSSSHFLLLVSFDLSETLFSRGIFSIMIFSISGGFS